MQNNTQKQKGNFGICSLVSYCHEHTEHLKFQPVSRGCNNVNVESMFFASQRGHTFFYVVTNSISFFDTNIMSSILTM